jgi:hypothetical protein
LGVPLDPACRRSGKWRKIENEVRSRIKRKNRRTYKKNEGYGNT